MKAATLLGAVGSLGAVGCVAVLLHRRRRAVPSEAAAEHPPNADPAPRRQQLARLLEARSKAPVAKDRNELVQSMGAYGAQQIGAFGGRFNDGVPACVVSFPARHHEKWNLMVLNQEAEKAFNVACVWVSSEQPEAWKKLWIQNVQEAIEEENRLLVVVPLDEQYGPGQEWELDWLSAKGLAYEFIDLESLGDLCHISLDADDGRLSPPPTSTAYLHVAVQPAAVMASNMVHRLAYRQTITELQTNLLAIGPELCGRKPVCLSDTRAVNFEDCPENGCWPHCLVWCASGGKCWESQSASDMPCLSVTELANFVRSSSRKPKIVFVVLSYGALWAAQQLCEAGLPNVFWVPPAGRRTAVATRASDAETRVAILCPRIQLDRGVCVCVLPCGGR